MAFRYPRMSNWLLFQDLENGKCQIYNWLTEERCEVDPQDAWFLQQLDGKTDPYRISSWFPIPVVDFLLDFFDEMQMLRSSRVLNGGINPMYSLFFPRITPRKRRFAQRLNRMLYLLFLPVMAAGIYLLLTNFPKLDNSWLGIPVGAIVGMMLHEMGHAIAGIAYGGLLFEVGVGLEYLVFPIAYTLLDDQFITSHLKKAQINAAGVEMNFLLVGVACALSAARVWPAFFFQVAATNMLMGCSNLIIIGGLDGMSVLSSLLGVDDLTKNARRNMLHWNKLRGLRRQGQRGKAAIYLSFVITLMQFCAPLLYLCDLGGIILWLF